MGLDFPAEKTCFQLFEAEKSLIFNSGRTNVNPFEKSKFETQVRKALKMLNVYTNYWLQKDLNEQFRGYNLPAQVIPVHDQI